MSSARASVIVDELLSTVDYLRITVADTGERWLPCGPLVDDPQHLAAVIATTKGDRGTDRADVATSLFVQGYAFRIASVAIGSWLLGDTVLDVSPANTSIAMGRGRPNAVNLTGVRDAAPATVAELHTVLVDGHLARLVSCARRTCRVGGAMLWGNVAASCVSSFAAFAAAIPARRVEIRDRAEEFLANGRRELRTAGRLVHVGEGFAWERRSCCLWYRTESAWLCEDCSLRPDSDRQQRYAAMLAGESGTDVGS